MTRPRIEPRSLEPLANTLLICRMARFINKDCSVSVIEHIYIYIYETSVGDRQLTIYTILRLSTF